MGPRKVVVKHHRGRADAFDSPSDWFEPDRSTSSGRARSTSSGARSHFGNSDRFADGGGEVYCPRHQTIERWVARQLGAVDHERRVTTIASSLFELTWPLHQLAEGHLEMLRLAAVVHDVGRAIHNKTHPVQGARLVLSELSLPLTAVERRAALGIPDAISQGLGARGWAGCDPEPVRRRRRSSAGAQPAACRRCIGQPVAGVPATGLCGTVGPGNPAADAARRPAISKPTAPKPGGFTSAARNSASWKNSSAVRSKSKWPRPRHWGWSHDQRWVIRDFLLVNRVVHRIRRGWVGGDVIHDLGWGERIDMAVKEAVIPTTVLHPNVTGDPSLV